MFIYYSGKLWNPSSIFTLMKGLPSLIVAVGGTSPEETLNII